MSHARIRHWLLADLEDSFLEDILRKGREVRFAAGDVIFRQGSRSDGVYLILDGTVEVSAVGSGGDTALAWASADDVLGEMGALDGMSRSATARAVTPCTAHFLPSETFRVLLRDSAPTCLRLLDVLARRLRGANLLVAELPLPR
jgi:CRP-like cAMP-binding protein